MDHRITPPLPPRQNQCITPAEIGQFKQFCVAIDLVQMALSKIPDLTHSYKGQEYTFVGQLEDYLKEIECPICHSIVSEPLLASCGHLFCKACHNKLDKACHNKLERPMGYYLLRKRNGRSIQCPVCTQQHTTVEDKFIDSRVKNLKVRCINHTKGCDWMGCLSDEGQHRAQQGGCDYEEIQCVYGCGVTIHRMIEQAHSVECPMRPHNCEYCGDEGPYQCILGDHLDTCRRYPVQCPNGCQEKIPREAALSEIKLKEVLSSTVKKLEDKEQYAHQLECDMKAKTEYIQQLEGVTAQNTTLKKLVSEVKSEQRIIYTSLPVLMVICAILSNNFYFILFLLFLSIVACIERGTQ